MSATVRIEGEVWSDWRFRALAHALGCEWHAAIGKMAHLWGEVTKLTAQLDPDEPPVEHLPALVCGALMGVDPELAESALVASQLAEATPDGLRIKGVVGRVEWLRSKRAAGRKGGRSRARRADRDGGQFVSTDTMHQTDTRQQPGTATGTAQAVPVAPTRPTATATATATATVSDAAHPGERFRVARERARKSQEQIARAHLAVTPRQLSKWERGQIDLDPMVVEQLEAILSRSAPAASDAHPDHAAFVAWFTDEWRAFQGQPAGPTWNSRTGAQVRERLQGLGLEELKRRARNMFERAAVGQWPGTDRSDATWGTLYRCTDNLVTGARKAPGQYTMPTFEDFEREAERERQEDER